MARRKGHGRKKAKSVSPRLALHPDETCPPCSTMPSLPTKVVGWFQIYALALLLALHNESLLPLVWSLLWTATSVVVNVLISAGMFSMLMSLCPWIYKLVNQWMWLCVLGGAAWISTVIAIRISQYVRKDSRVAFQEASGCVDISTAGTPLEGKDAVVSGGARSSRAPGPARETQGTDTLPHALSHDFHQSTNAVHEVLPDLNKRQRRAAKRAAQQVKEETASSLLPAPQPAPTELTHLVKAPLNMPKALNSKQRRAAKQAAKLKQAAEDGSAGPNDSRATITSKYSKPLKGSNKGMGSTGNPSGGSKSPERPETPPQGPQKTPSSTGGPLAGKNSKPNSQAFRTSIHKGKHSKASGGKPSLYEQIGSNTANTSPKTPARGNNTSTHHTSKTAVLFEGVKPLVGSKVDFAHNIDHFEEQKCPLMVKKLKELPHLSGWRSIRGDGNCAYRAVLMGILEGAAAADDYSRMMLGQQLGELYRKLPEWARSSFNGKSNVAYGHGLLKALVINAQKRSVDEMAAICCRQVESDSMLLFLRAIAAAAMAVDDMMELWAQPIREELPTSFKTYSLCLMVQNLVLPLAGSRDTALWKWRHGSHTELGTIANALRIQVRIHDVETEVFTVSEGPEDSGVRLSVLSSGCHIESVFE